VGGPPRHKGTPYTLCHIVPQRRWAGAAELKVALNRLPCHHCARRTAVLHRDCPVIRQYDSLRTIAARVLLTASSIATANSESTRPRHTPSHPRSRERRRSRARRREHSQLRVPPASGCACHRHRAHTRVRSSDRARSPSAAILLDLLLPRALRLTRYPPRLTPPLPPMPPPLLLLLLLLLLPLLPPLL